VPDVSLVIVNFNGAEHRPACLDSVAALEEPPSETIVVDNASTDGSLELLARHYPWVRVLPQSENLGFAGGVNAGARAAFGSCLALCNNDMRLHPGWLGELLRGYDPRGGVPCVAGLILDWEGRKVDFADAYVTATGMAGQPGFGQAVEDVVVEDGRVLPFACGGSMLVGRERFLELGGFDPAFFALLEDVDFGWRLRLAGHDVKLAATAISYHRQSATVATIPQAERTTMVERNALRMLLKNVGDENLTRLLAPALALFALRSEEAVRRNALADVLDDDAGIAAERRRVQGMRVRSDAQVFALFGRPFLPAANDLAYLETSAALTRLFQLGELFPERRATTVVVVGDDERTRTLARIAAPLVRVVYIAPERVELEGVEVLVLDDSEPVVAEADVVIDTRTELDADGLRRLLLRPSRLGPTEDEQLLLARRRRARGIGQPTHERLARSIWSRLPPRLRGLVRAG
jgi:GT2 family glycosyltransferase